MSTNSKQPQMKNTIMKPMSMIEKFSPQAVLLTVVLLILSVIMGYLTFSSDGAVAPKIVVYIFWLISCAVFIYDTYCLVNGDCHTWSWIRTILYIIGPIIFMIIFFVSMAKVNELNNKVKESENEKLKEKNEEM